MEMVRIIDFIVFRNKDYYYFCGKRFKTEELFTDYFFNDFLPKTNIYKEHPRAYDELFDDFNV